MSLSSDDDVCIICKKSRPANRSTYCSNKCMYKRGNELRRNKRRPSQQRTAGCKRCGAWWTHLRGGQLPSLCMGCGETHIWCAKCDTVKLKSEFHRNGRQGHNRTCRSCHASYMRTPRVRAQQRWAAIRKAYGLTQSDFEAMVEAQEGRCGLCGELPTELVVDHCHMTGKIRTLLCRPCNTSIGIFGDDPARLRRALDYLLAHQV